MSRLTDIIKELKTDYPLGPDSSEYVTRADLAEALEAVLEVMD